MDKALLLGLWPFEGGFTWQAAEAVAESDAAALANLAALVDRSVVTVETSSGTARYRISETVRHYWRRMKQPSPQHNSGHDPLTGANWQALAELLTDIVAQLPIIRPR
ncbi:hypothetical protein [Nocardia sp. NBC_01009]|uniref:hypothetical protein n=1 Tax=Nocardia sp. NBC_01009 TaxID=2975996 RepID=UPI00386F825A|nr:hypothetical protein OHA42_33840 [Nocardia sp. NBC_01009]